MGQEIVYCLRCNSRLLAGEFESGGAFYVDGKPSCVDCVMGRLSELSPREEARVLKTLEEHRGPAPTPRSGTPASTAPVRSGKRKTSTAHIPHVKTERRAPPPTQGPLLAILGGVAVVVLLLVVALASAPRPRPAPEPKHGREAASPEPAPDVHRGDAPRKIPENP